MPEFDPDIIVDEPADERIRQSPNPKIVFGVILFFGIFTLAFGTLKIWKDIRSPAIAQEQARASYESQASLASPSVPTDEELQARDSDRDGLSDWDELNRFGTSPYLADSDADSYPDKTELDTNNDPNCPRGQNCGLGAAPPAPVPAGGSFSELAPTTPPESLGTAPPDLTNLTPAQLRELLLQTGEVTSAQLDQVDDATLMQMYQETLSQQQSAQQQPQ